MQAPPPNVTFGALPRKRTAYGSGTFPKWEDKFDLFPRKNWQPVSLNRHVKTIYDQLDGMCTANGATGVMMTERSIRGRRPHVTLSPEHLYGLVARWGEGSSLDEILQAMVEIGVCSRDMIPQENWRPIDWPNEDFWRADAAQNRMLEWIDLNADFDAVATALQQHRPCLVGVRWPGGGGHAVGVTELWQDVRGWGIAGPNSWGPKWNYDGFYELTERQCADFGTFGCWAAGAST